MIGKQKSQLSLLDSAFNARTKRSRADKLLKKIDKYVDWDSLESICTRMYKDTNRGRPSLPIVFGLKCLILQYLYDLSDPALEDAQSSPAGKRKQTNARAVFATRWNDHSLTSRNIWDTGLFGMLILNETSFNSCSFV